MFLTKQVHRSNSFQSCARVVVDGKECIVGVHLNEVRLYSGDNLEVLMVHEHSNCVEKVIGLPESTLIALVDETLQLVVLDARGFELVAQVTLLGMSRAVG